MFFYFLFWFSLEIDADNSNQFNETTNESISSDEIDKSLENLNLTKIFSTLKNSLNHTDFRIKHPIDFTKLNKMQNNTNVPNKRPKIETINETEQDKKIKKMLNESLWLIPMSDTLQALI